MEKYLKNYSETIYPFHMPGHKLGRLSPLEQMNLYQIDVTEVPGTDNLHQPEGIILKAQERAKKLYNSLDTFFLVNGSSSGLLSAISASCKQDGQILIARNSHKSIYHAIQLNRLDPIYVYPKVIEAYGLLGGIDPEDVRRELHNNPLISCVVLTSPTFEGFTSDIKTIAKIVHENGKILIIDEAHGAHFKFHADFPSSALESGADIVIQSVHKTLPALTQSALLHVNSHRVDLETLKQYLDIYQTSSPSYILMAGIDSCMGWIEKEGSRAFEIFSQNIQAFRGKIHGLKHMMLLDQSFTGQYAIHEIDLSRLVFVGKKGAINGKKVDNILRDTYNIQFEMATLGSLVAISTVADQLEAFENLFRAFSQIDMKNDYINTEKFDIINKSTKVIHPYTASLMKKETVDLKEAKDRISAQFVTLYPPGIPILIPGELITPDIIETLFNYVHNGLTVNGLAALQLCVLREV